MPLTKISDIKVLIIQENSKKAFSKDISNVTQYPLCYIRGKSKIRSTFWTQKCTKRISHHPNPPPWRGDARNLLVRCKI